MRSNKAKTNFFEYRCQYMGTMRALCIIPIPAVQNKKSDIKDRCMFYKNHAISPKPKWEFLYTYEYEILSNQNVGMCKAKLWRSIGQVKEYTHMLLL